MAFMKAVALPLSGCQNLRLLLTAPHFVHSHHVSSSTLSYPSCSLKSASRRTGITSHGNGIRHQIRMRKNVMKVFASGYGGEEQVAVKDFSDEDYDKQLQDSDTRVLAAVKSRYNFITVLEIARDADHLLAGARMLLLDNPGCIHSIYYNHRVLTNSYYDVLATLDPLIPADGPVGLLGLGAGSCAHILHHFYPTRDMHGWELDPEIINVARHFFDLSTLEAGVIEEAVETDAVANPAKKNAFFVDQEDAAMSIGNGDAGGGRMKPHSRGGILTVHIGDALGQDVMVDGGFAGLIVDLFAEGRVLPMLQEPQTWQQLKEKLRPGGRIIVNCGGARLEREQEIKSEGQIYMEATLVAMAQVFPGQLCRRYLARKGFNTVAITGPVPDIEHWAHSLPEALQDGISDWLPVV